ncbi:hypothetical protein IAQ61_004162 [Plenodomus lingam]|uniref:Rhodanese domain-containing protein n=1 Tax=Leptosphaeria maculans (strain JN3 / isolate v23.1.3 / race Av1-4-5-6-7-8) TaxID=985895 RepID=E4ZXD2_LEPMJ|nr:hypothetical protein LEMA_P024940.1 [Plenodomus lingam JN3]KAH9873538.1 hypothetical protein IAQ61_004162 [Plenodomus lingam]CBX95342.1 hypothetical protein LEMA_P024940.1 [Plenodomus lingam JN3]
MTTPPNPTTTAPTISPTSLLPLLPTPSLLLIDVRRTDYEGGAIHGSLNLPAQSFYANRSVLYDLCKRAGVRRVVFYCGSSNGRGPRCAAWFAEYIDERQDGEMVALTLEGGIKGWVKAGEAYTQCVDGYEAGHWKQFD